MELRPDLWHCAGCGTAYAVGLPACPQCGSALRIHPGYGTEMHGVEHAADGTMSPLIGNDPPDEEEEAGGV